MHVGVQVVRDWFTGPAGAKGDGGREEGELMMGEEVEDGGREWLEGILGYPASQK